MSLCVCVCVCVCERERVSKCVCWGVSDSHLNLVEVINMKGKHEDLTTVCRMHTHPSTRVHKRTWADMHTYLEHQGDHGNSARAHAWSELSQIAASNSPSLLPAPRQKGSCLVLK